MNMGQVQIPQELIPVAKEVRVWRPDSPRHGLDPGPPPGCNNDLGGGIVFTS